jgi:hypothetical protein
MASTPRIRGSWIRRITIGGLGVALLLLVAALRASFEGPATLERLWNELASDASGLALYRRSPGLQAGFGSEAAFLAHVGSWRPRFGGAERFQGPDQAKRLLPFAVKLEVQGRNGAWFAVLARTEPFPRLHGVAFGATREEARRACFNQYAKAHLAPWLERGLAAARAVAGPQELPASVADLQPDRFEFGFVAGGAELRLLLRDGGQLTLHIPEEGGVRMESGPDRYSLLSAPPSPHISHLK